MIVEVGMTGSAETLVERADTAQEVGSGSLLVYATPCMVALMEGAACEAIAPALPAAPDGFFRDPAVPCTFFSLSIDPSPPEPGFVAWDLFPPYPGLDARLPDVAAFISGIRITSCSLILPARSFTAMTRSFSPAVRPVRAMVSVPSPTWVPFWEVSSFGRAAPACVT